MTITHAAAFGQEHFADPLAFVRHLADRGLAPLEPFFVAIKTSWAIEVPPGLALRSVLLLTLFGRPGGENSGRALCADLADDGTLRAFLGLKAGEHLDEAALTAALDRLIKNKVARRFVSEVIATAAASGLTTDGRCRFDQSLAESWRV